MMIFLTYFFIFVFFSKIIKNKCLEVFSFFINFRFVKNKITSKIHLQTNKQTKMTEMKAQLLTELPYHRVRDNTLQTLCEIRSGHSMTLKFKTL